MLESKFIFRDTLTSLPATLLPPPSFIPMLWALRKGRPTQYRLASLRYDLRKLRAKGLVEKLPKSRRYRLRPQGYSICLVLMMELERSVDQLLSLLSEAPCVELKVVICT